MTATPVLGGFSKSLSIQLTGSSLQPRYFCTDIDSCELPEHRSEGSTDRKTPCPSSNSNPIQTKTIESNPICSDIQSHKCLEAMRLSTNQQQNKNHSTNFFSKNENSAIFSTYGGTKVSLIKPNLFEVEPIALSNDLVSTHNQDSNPLSADIWLTSGTNDESVLPIMDQAWGSTDTDFKKVLKL